MLAQPNNEQTDSDYKRQYQEVLKELDAREKEWAQDKQKLLKSVLSLTFVFQGENDELDQQLFDLKENLKQSRNRLPQQKIDTAINAVLARKKAGDADRSRTCQLIHNVLSLLQADKRLNRFSDKVNAIAAELEDSAVSPVSKLKQVNTIITDINKQVSREQQKPDLYKVFLKKLAVNDQTNADLAALCKKSIKLVDEKELLQSINDCIEVINELNHEPARVGQTEKVEVGIGHVLTLLDWVTIPGKSQKKLDSLKSQLQERKDSNEVGNLLRRLSITISNAYMDLQSELTETEGFLKRITNQLNEITLQIADIQKLENETFSHTTCLNEELDKQIKLIQSGVDEADSIEKIKETINQRIEILQDNMDQFIKVEQTRKQESKEHHQQLVERLGNMEKETETLRKCIEEEKNKALHDALTSIANRMAFDARINTEFKRWQRYNSRLTLCLIDIDKFKNVNDTYGHKAGDIVLRTVANKCASRIRTSDFFCRYGGEEFALILPETGIEAAQRVADALRETIEKCTFQYKEEVVPITVSCGLAEFKGRDTIDTAFQRADKALYKAKDLGRNRCIAEHQLGLASS